MSAEETDTAAVCPHLAAPHPLFDLTRAGERVFFYEERGLWVVARYDDVVAALKDHARFASQGAVKMSVRFAPETLELIRQALPYGMRTLVNVDPPDHTRIRAVVNRAFTPRRVAELEPAIRGLSEALIDQMIGAGQADLVAQLAQQLPMQVIYALLGIPEADRAQLKQWCFDWMTLVTAALPPEEQLPRAQSLVRYTAYMRELVERRRAAPQDDFISDLTRSVDQGEAPITIHEMLDIINLLMTAGQETTAHLIASCLYRLLSVPARWRAVVAAPERIPALVEETLRYDGVTLGSLRIAREDVTIGGVTIPRGATVLLALAGANHDPQIFPEPQRFDPERPNLARHLAFGNGIHYCLGAPLGRLELRVVLERLAARLPDLRLAPGAQLSYQPSLMMRGLVALPVEWDRRPAA
jgi:cytochrome P450